MKVPARIRISTVQNGNSEFECTGYFENLPSGFALSYGESEKYSLVIEMSSESAEITREGDDGYRMTLSKGKATYFRLDEYAIELFTSEFNARYDEHRAQLTAKYYLGDKSNLTEISVTADY